MLSIPPASYDSLQIVLDHVSAQGPVVTHVRGTMIVNSRENLREVGEYERYVELLPAAYRERLLYAISASWLPVDVALAHYHTCDLLDLAPSQLSRLGELMASRIIDTFMGRALRVARDAGAETFWLLLKRNDYIFDRMYQGGCVRVYQTGPKDLILENRGQPLSSCRYWRQAYLAYMEALGRAFARTSFVKLVRPPSGEPSAIAVAGSWV